MTNITTIHEVPDGTGVLTMMRAHPDHKLVSLLVVDPMSQTAGNAAIIIDMSAAITLYHQLGLLISEIVDPDFE